jgi:hypothetical protein
LLCWHILTIAGLVYFLHARTQRLRSQERESVILRGNLERFWVITDVEAEVARLRTQAAAEHQQMRSALGNTSQ